MAAREGTHIRGRKLIRAREADILKASDDPGFQWNGLRLPSNAKHEGFLYLGQTGSGKTICLSLLAHDVLTSNSKAKAVIHDFKMNFLPLLRAFGIPEDRVKILNPYDRRCLAWDIQADCPDWDAALEIAHGFIPELPNEGSSTFFRTGARFLLAGVMRYFLLETLERGAKGEKFRWTLHDVIECAKDKQIMREMFEKYPNLKTNLAYLDRQNDDILATLFQPLDELGSIPNLWAGKVNAPEKMISFYRWANGDVGEILVLGSDPNRDASLSVINRIMLNRMMKATISRRDERKAETWFFLDEFHALGRIASFEKFVSVCRDFKGGVAVATQDIAQLDALYGEHHRATIMTNLVTKTFLKCSGEAAEWASKQLGSREVRVEGQNESISGAGYQSGSNYTDQMKPLVIATEFDELPMFSKFQTMIKCYGTTAYSPDALVFLLASELAPVIRHGRMATEYELETDARKMIPKPLEAERLKGLGINGTKEKVTVPVLVQGRRGDASL
jgi:hypothetical protein